MIRPADLSALHAIVPIRGTTAAKSRLGQALDAEERGELVMGLLARTLDTLLSWPACSAVHVVSDDARGLDVLRRRAPTANFLVEAAPEGLNRALGAAIREALVGGASAVLILPADLPLLSIEALERLLEAADATLAAGNGQPIVVIAPADARGGTNALLISPPGIIEPQFGDSSFEAHVRAAAGAEASLQLVIDPALGFDLDTPDDLERLDLASLLELERLGRALLSEPVPAAI